MKFLEHENAEGCFSFETKQIEENGRVRLETTWTYGPSFVSQWIEDFAKEE